MNHCVEGLERGVGVCALEGGIGGGFEEGKDIFVFALEVLLGGFEVLAEELLGEAEEGLVLWDSILVILGGESSGGGGVSPGANGFHG